MKLTEKILSAVALRLPSFIKNYFENNKKSLKHRLIKAFSVVISVMLIMAISSEYLLPVITTAADAFGVVSEDGVPLRHLNFELYPNEEQSQKSVTLDGLMPKDASATAVDVTRDFSDSDGYHAEDEAVITAHNPSAGVLAAYNITITDGIKEYQPNEDYPILVEIADPEINTDDITEIWHIKDDGTREPVSDFDIEDGKISFYAVGFSVYAIVTAPDPFVPSGSEQVTSLSSLSDSRAASGFYLYYTTNAGKNNYFTNSLNSGGCLIETDNIGSASVWYFEADGDYYKIYTYVNGAKKYIHTKSGNQIELSDSADLLELSDSVTENAFYFKKKDETRYLQHSNGGGGIRYYTDNNNAANSSIKLDFSDTSTMPDDYYQLDGETFGLMNYSGGTLGYAFMADEDNNSLSMLSLVVRTDNSANTLYVAEDSDISMWTFHSLSSNNYLLSTKVGGTTKYLHIGDNSLTLTDIAEASTISVTCANNKVKLTSGGKTVAFGEDSFVSSAAADNSAQWFNLVQTSGLLQDDYVTYSSEKTGVSDVPDGASVIVYTRIWNEQEKAYEFYAVDHRGNLYPCYERGDYIMWVGNRINTLLWNFTEYHYDDGSPNYYYELYNPYSRKYIAPQIDGGQTLSDTKIGINMPGRRAGEYYTDIVAWDENHYTYAGLSTDIDNNKVTSSSRANAETFYFAVVETPTPTLTKVDTIDNSQYGISMKMIDFPVQPDKTTGEYFQNDFLGTGTTSLLTATKGLLSTNLGSSGYPTVRSGESLGSLYSGATDANHLFIESVYNASGYFEFDSCQNFATLVQEDGTIGTDFTVYKELGTTDNTSKTTLKHGQFFPYDTITAGVYSTKNPENLYSALAQPEYPSVGLLPDSDPRKYEHLHNVGSSPNYYNGMEMSASFVQTPSGKDAWGHDIIFEFTGDDDFWLYVDGELVIDLGGIHSALAGSVNFATGDVFVEGEQTNLRAIFESNYTTRNPSATAAEVEEYLSQYFEEGENIFKDYSAHTMKIFYMERGAGASNLHMRFNLSYVTSGHVMLTKNVTGTDDMDFDLVEYPYQIWYKDEEYGDPHLLTNTDNLVNVTYQNSTQKVDYVPVYTPPNSTVSYESVYFLHPSKNAEIHFPSDTIEYRIIECGVNSEVYDTVRVNGTEVEGTSIGNTNRNYYDSGWLSVSDRPNIVFENHVDEDALRTLSIQKMLYDENGNFLSAENDGTTFNFRLYLSNGVDDTLTLANMYKYFVKDSEGYYCEWNSTTKTFVPTEKRSYSLLTDAEKESLSYDTSMNGAISKIPSGYTVEVPNLPVGTRFKVEERDYEIPLGYKLDNYEREASTYRSEDGDTLNSGWVRANESPKMYVNNKRGWEVQVNKSWSDKDYVSSHESIFTAIYDGNDLVTGTVRQIKHPDTSLRYFFDTLPQGVSFENYNVYEVELENPVFDSNGDLLSYSAVHRRLNDGDLTTIDAVPNNSDTSGTFSYAATYNRGEVSATAESVTGNGNIRTDNITNTRTGGLVITLYDMNTREPLANGVFTLTTGDTQIGTFTSDEFGRVTILYDFERETDYVLTETSPPSTYIGLPNPAVFSIGANDSIFISGNEVQWENGHKSEEEGDQLIAYIDVFNKPFTLRAVKVDGGTDAALGGAHFALYRSVSGIGGAVKDVSPLEGYEDLVSGDDGVIPGIDNTLAPGKYYLTETSAPSDYEGLNEDIVFTITSTGDVIINSTEHSGYLSTISGNEIDYVMSIPNTKTDTDAVLSITKTVDGNFGDKNKEFTFTLAVSGAQAEDEYEWTKNGVEQTAKLHGNSTFTLKHGDVVAITLPQDVNITVTESNENYVASFKLGDETAQTVNTKTFMLSEDTALEVTNTLNGIVPTGIYTNFAIMFALLIPSAVTAFIVIKQWKKRYKKNER